jgi:hypothetical protein
MHSNLHIGRHVRRVTATVKGVLQSGITPKKLSLTISMGTAVGLMPVLWGTSLLCMLLAGLFRLNQAAMQAVNYLCYPLQIALFIPFCSLGQALFPWGPKVSAALLTGALHGHLGATASLIAWASLRGLGAWLVTVPPLALVLYPVLSRFFLRRVGDAEKAL